MADQTESEKILLQGKDIDYLRTGMDKLTEKVDAGFKEVRETMMGMNEHFIHRDEYKKDMLLHAQDIAALKKEKLDIKTFVLEFNPIKNTLTKLNWLLIVAVVTGILALIIHNPLS